MEDVRDFIKERTTSAVRRGSNCIGSALYLVGEIEHESYYSREKGKIKLSRMKNSLRPELGYIALWQSGGELFHAGVIFEENPFKIVHREESNGLLVQADLGEFAAKLKKFTGLTPVYKIPSKFG